VSGVLCFVVLTYLVLGRRARGRGGLGEVVIGSLLGLRSVVYSGMKAMDRSDYMFSSPLCPGHGNRLVAVVVEGLECCSWNRPRLKFFREQRAEHQRWFLPQSTLPCSHHPHKHQIIIHDTRDYHDRGDTLGTVIRLA
jgi:hypothetical protein